MITLNYYLILSALLFAIGTAGVFLRRNLITVLLSIEIMLNAASLAFIAAGARWGEPDGQVMYLFILTLAAAEVSVALGIVLQLQYRFQTLDADAFSRMKG